MYNYIYIERERYRERDKYTFSLSLSLSLSLSISLSLSLSLYIYIIQTHTHMHEAPAPGHPRRAPLQRGQRRSEHDGQRGLDDVQERGSDAYRSAALPRPTGLLPFHSTAFSDHSAFGHLRQV